MRNLTKLGLAAALASALGLALGACEKPKETKVDMESKVKTTTPQGDEQVTKTEAEKVGNSMEASKETKTEAAGQTTKTEEETVIGTVDKYEVGKSISIKTNDDKTHRFDLDDKDTLAEIDTHVAVGSHVKLVKEKGDNGQVVIRVSIQA